MLLCKPFFKHNRVLCTIRWCLKNWACNRFFTQSPIAIPQSVLITSWTSETQINPIGLRLMHRSGLGEAGIRKAHDFIIMCVLVTYYTYE